MNTSESTIPVIPNGSGAAAMLAAAIGSFVLAVISLRRINLFFRKLDPFSYRMKEPARQGVVTPRSESL